MGLSRKLVLAKIAGKRKGIKYHLDKHIPGLLGTADQYLVEYWRREVGRLVAEMEELAQRLAKNRDILKEAEEYRRRLTELLDRRLEQLD